MRDARRIAGYLELAHARVKWFLSTEMSDLPFTSAPGAKTTHRSIMVDGEEIEFSEGFADLHTRVYENVLAGRGLGIEESRPAVDLCARIRAAAAQCVASRAHPMALVRR